MPKTQPNRRKHIPVRTCVQCRQTGGKRELVRVVRTVDAGVQVDLTGKLAGRGAYLCRNRACWTGAIAGRRIAAALRTTLTEDELGRLKQFADTLAPEPEQSSVGLE